MGTSRLKKPMWSRFYEKYELPAEVGPGVWRGVEIKDYVGDIDMTWYDEGRKDDDDKQRWDLVPYDALGQIVNVLTFGARKYDPRNWEKGIRYGRVFAALQRHLTAWWEGEDMDPESKQHHLAHAGCCLLFLLAYETRELGEGEQDDRPHNDSGA